MGRLLALSITAILSLGCTSKDDGSAATTGGPGAAPTKPATAAPGGSATGFSAGGATAKPGSPQPVPWKPVFSRASIQSLSGCSQDSYVMLDQAGKSSRNIAALLQPLRMFQIGTATSQDGSIEIRAFRAGAEDREDSPNTIVAKCGTPETCNELAAYLAHARVFPKPQLFCGKPTVFGTYDTSVGGFGPTSKPLIPDKDETETLCARVAGCRYDADPTLPPKLFTDCAKQPTKFKALCGLEKTCAEVVACVAK